MELPKNKIKQVLEVSRLYYIDNMSQVDISKKLNLSRPTISRLLQAAKEQNIVEIKINDPFQNMDSLKQQLKQKFNLKDVIIALQTNDDKDTILDKLGEETAKYLEHIIRNNDVIGISWGKTMDAVANHLKESDRSNINVVQLKGSVTNSRENNFSIDITRKFNAAYHTQTQILPLPVIFDNARTKDLVVKDRFIKNVIEQGYQANIALFTVGTTLSSAMLFRLGYLDDIQIDHLKRVSVGDVLSRFITAEGRIADSELNNRTVSIALDALKDKEYSVLIAGGRTKLKPIHAALLGGYPNVLITDQNTAKKLLEL
ncbi:sugar-binding transcriptional regulator [Sporolactobacillus sp. KGMB 08714]|uniref:sugar-binding transcriptional regulator n=1 Tax=Sporolactobacillus sp. KGMB 08714 TaxID=3064704 RepID=UPI002FBD38DD